MPNLRRQMMRLMGGVEIEASGYDPVIVENARKSVWLRLFTACPPPLCAWFSPRNSA